MKIHSDIWLVFLCSMCMLVDEVANLFVYFCRCLREALKGDSASTMTSAEMHPSHCSLTGSLSSSASFRRSERAQRRVAECAAGSPSSGASYRCHNMPPARLHSAAIPHEPSFTNFAQLLRQNMPPAPPQLLKKPGRKDSGPGKVRMRQSDHVV